MSSTQTYGRFRPLILYKQWRYFTFFSTLKYVVIKGTFHIKPKSHKAKWTDDRECECLNMNASI